MRTLTIKKSPSTDELVEALQKGLPNDFSYALFGLGREKSIVIRKSFFVGAQVSKRGNDISIEGMSPSRASWLLAFLDMLISDRLVSAVFFGSAWEKLEKEIAVILKREYD